MGNCLKTQLKESVQNENLKELNTMIIEFETNSSGGSSLVRLQLPEQKSKLYDNNGLLLRDFSLDTTNYYLAANKKYVLKVNNKYELGILELSGQGGFASINANVDDLAFTTFRSDSSFSIMYKIGVVGHFSSIKNYYIAKNSTSISIFGTSIEVSMAEFAALPNAENITSIQTSDKASGHIMDISSMFSLSNLLFRGNVVYKTELKEFLDTLWSNGKRGTLALNMPADYSGNNAGITKYNPTITFVDDSGIKWTWV